jgi:hypothetical protein
MVLSFGCVYVIQGSDVPSDLSQSEIAHNFLGLIKKFLQGIARLDYYESDGLYIDLPDNKIFKIWWADKGSGNILRPFASPKVTIEDIDGECLLQQNNKDIKDNQFSLGTLLKLFIKTKIKTAVHTLLEAYKDSLNGWGWLLNSKLSAVEVFGLKLYLLMKHDFGKNVDRKKIEIIRLLFRLSQSDIVSIFDSEHSLFSYLPTSLFEKLKIDANWLAFIDDMWKKLRLNARKYTFDDDGVYDVNQMGIFVCGYEFSNKYDAQECFETIKNKSNYSYADFRNDVEKNTQLKYFGVSNNFKEFGKITKESHIASLPEKVKEWSLAVSGGAKVALIEVNEKKYWVVYANDKLSTIDSIHMILICFLKAMEEYKGIKAQNNTDVSVRAQYTQETSKEREQILRDIEDLEKEKIKLQEQLFPRKQKADSFLKEIKSLESVHGCSVFDKKALEDVRSSYKKLVDEINIVENNVKRIEKTIRDLRNSPKYFLGEYEIKDIRKITIWQLVLEVFIKSPEFKHVLADINCVEQYKIVKDNLYKRIGNILNNSIDFEKNQEMWGYIVASIFPDLNGYLADIKKDKKDQKNISSDTFLNALLGV